MLFYAGVSSRVGDVDSGTTTTDYMKEEMERGITIQSALVTLQWDPSRLHMQKTATQEMEAGAAGGGPPTPNSSSKPLGTAETEDHTHRIYLLDTPGHADFTIEVERSVRVVDGVVAVLDAAAGVQAQSYTVLSQSVRHGVPIIGFINKMDKSNANFFASVASLQHKLQVEPLLLQLPLEGDGGEFQGVVDLITLECCRFGGQHGERVEITPALPSRQGSGAAASDLSAAQVAQVLEFRHQLLAQLTAADDPLSERFIHALDATDGDEAAAELAIAPAEIRAAIRRVLLSPPPALQVVTRVSGRAGHVPLMDAICHYLPSPLERRVQGLTEKGAPTSSWPLPPSPSSSSPLPPTLARGGGAASLDALLAASPLLALAFKVCHTTNPATGRREPLVYLRLYSGVLLSGTGRAGAVLFNRTRQVDVLRPGEVGAVFLRKTFTGDTLFAPPARRPRQAGRKGLDRRRPSPPPPTFRKSASSPATPVKSEEEEAEEEEEEGIYLLEGIEAPPPVLAYAIEAATAAQSQQLDTALAELTREDPSLSFRVDDFGNRVLQGLGELHLEIALSRLQNEYQLSCRLLRATVAYRETLAPPSFTEEEDPKVPQGFIRPHKFLSHQHGAPYAELVLSIQPLRSTGDMERLHEGGARMAAAEPRDDRDPDLYDAGAVPQFVLAPGALAVVVSGGTAGGSRQDASVRTAEGRKNLQEWRLAVHEGFSSAVADVARMGPWAGMPLHGVAVVLHHFRRLAGGSAGGAPAGETAYAHGAGASQALVDSGVAGVLPPASQALASMAREVLLPLVRDIAREGATALLEPIMLVEIHLTEPGFTGEVVRELNERQALFIDIHGGPHQQVITAHVPMGCLTKFSVALRTAVKGHATLSLQLHSYRRLRDPQTVKRILKSRGITTSNNKWAAMEEDAVERLGLLHHTPTNLLHPLVPLRLQRSSRRSPHNEEGGGRRSNIILKNGRRKEGDGFHLVSSRCENQTNNKQNKNKNTRPQGRRRTTPLSYAGCLHGAPVACRGTDSNTIVFLSSFLD
eukprot:gene4724-3416_t